MELTLGKPMKQTFPAKRKAYGALFEGALELLSRERDGTKIVPIKQKVTTTLINNIAVNLARQRKQHSEFKNLYVRKRGNTGYFLLMPTAQVGRPASNMAKSKK